MAQKHGSDAAAGPPPGADAASTKGKALVTPGQVLVVSSVMFTFISFWRPRRSCSATWPARPTTSAASSRSQIGKAAPWFILAVMLFSYAVRSVYIESCSLFVRGGVYRVVKEAMGGFLAKLVGLGPDVRLHPHRADQRRLGRPVHHRPGQRAVRSWAKPAR